MFIIYSEKYIVLPEKDSYIGLIFLV